MSHKFPLIISISFLFYLTSISAQNTGAEFYQPFSASERPEYSEDLPEFVKMTLLPNPNFHKVEEAFEAYEKAEKAKKISKNTEGVEVEDIYDVYFNRWRRAYQPFVQEDGSIVLPTKADYKRMIQTDNFSRSRQLSTRSAANWTLVGPMETYLPKWTNPAQPAASWQVNIEAFDIFEANTSILYAVPESGGVFKTNDKGLNWTACAPNFNFGSEATAVKIHPTNSDIVYISANNFFYKTTDGGDTWTDLTSCPASDAYEIAISPANANLIFVTAPNGFYRSADAGVTWTTLYTTPTYDIKFKTDEANTVFLFKSNGTYSEFLKSTDGGVTFTVKSTGTTTLRRGRMAVTTINPNRIYMLCKSSPNPPRLLKSNDAGETWTDINAAFCTSGVSDAEGGVRHALDIVISPDNADEIIYGQCSLVKAVSADGGNTFTYTNLGGYCGIYKIHPDASQIQTIKVGSIIETWVATDGGMTLSTDFFSTAPQDRNKGIYTSDFWGFGQGWNEDIMVGGRYHNGNTALADFYPSGKAMQLGGGEAGTGYVLHGQQRKAVFSDSRDVQLPSTFTGDDWANLPDYSKFPNEDGNGFDASSFITHPYYSYHQFIGEGNAIWKTTDNGVSFVSLYDFGSRVRRFDISRSNPSVLYLATDVGLFKSTNGGSAWSPITIPAVPTARNPQYAYMAINPNNEQDVWITFKNDGNSTASGKVFQSTDGGSTWTDKTTSVLNTHKIKHIVHTGGGIYISTNANESGANPAQLVQDKVFYRSTSATNWTDYSNGLLPMLRIIGMKPFYRDGKVRIAGNQGIWETPLAETVAPIALPMVDKQSSDCSSSVFQFDDYSILNHSGATWLWSFSPTPQYVSSLTARNPTVIFGAQGNYSATLTVTNSAGSSTRTVTNMVTISGTACSVDTIPSMTASLPGSSSDYIISTTAFPNAANDDFSISFWMKTSDATTTPRTILGTRNVSNSTSNTNQGWAFVIRSGKLHFELGDGAAVQRVATTANINDGAWHYIAGTVNNAGNMVLLVDGVSIGTQSISTLGTISNGAFLYIGKDNHGGETAYPYTGLIDEIKIWNTPLTTDEVREKMHLTAYAAQEPNLVTYYQFNNTTTGTLEYDRKGINNLTFNGGATRVASTAPIGGGTFFRLPVTASGVKTFTGTDCEIDFSSGTLPSGDVVVTKLNVAPNVNPATGTPLSNQYWIVNNFGTNTTFSPLTNIKFGNLGTFASGAANGFRLYKRASNTDAAWGSSIDVADALTTTNNNTLTFSTDNGITSFSQFTISQEIVLAADLLGFKAHLNDKNVELTWQVADEKEVKYYVIERSFDGKIFVSLTQHNKGIFSTTDEAPQYGTNYYRLKIVGNDNSITYSPIKVVIFEGLKSNNFKIYPNPTSDRLNIEFIAERPQTVELELMNVNGQIVYSYKLDGTVGNNRLFFNTSQFPAGLYTLKIKQDKVVLVQKIVLSTH
jgi:photosystem II stability/assembly factor-like uncharacterized protein